MKTLFALIFLVIMQPAAAMLEQLSGHLVSLDQGLKGLSVVIAEQPILPPVLTAAQLNALSQQQRKDSDQLFITMLKDVAEHEAVFKVFREYIKESFGALRAQEHFYKREQIDALISQLDTVFTLPQLIPTAAEQHDPQLVAFLSSFYTMHSKNGVAFAEPSQRYLTVFSALKALLIPCLFDSSILSAQDLRFIILTLVSSQRAIPGQISSVQKNMSNQMFIDALDRVRRLIETNKMRIRLGAQGDPDLTKNIIRQIDWLRVNPQFLKYRDMLLTFAKAAIPLPGIISVPPLLLMLVNPRKAGFSKKVSQAFVAQHYVRDACVAHFFGTADEFDEAIKQKMGGNITVLNFIASELLDRL